MDRRFILAIVLMMVVLVVPSLVLKRPPRPATGSVAAATVPSAPPILDAPGGTRPTKLTAEVAASLAPVAEDTVRVASGLYRYSFSSRGGRLIGAELTSYRSMRKDEPGQSAQILDPNGDFLALALLVGRDTIPLKNLTFRPSTKDLQVGKDGAQLSWNASLDSSTGVTLTYRFVPDNYRIAVSGRLTGLGPSGATLMIGMGPGLRNTEADSTEFARELGLVTRDTKSQLVNFSSLKPGELKSFSGPFQWVAIKAKYFVAAVISPDTNAAAPGRFGGVQAMATDRIHKSPETADVWTSLTLGSEGTFDFGLYVGPMEYPRLRAIGHGFDDNNPYGWAWLRPVIRPVAVGARWLLVWLHEKAGLAYGLGLVVFGVLIRLVLWPLNQKAMRASMAMQAIQPVLKDIQDRHKNDPQRLQQEMFKVYKENSVNPFSGCWPVLLPWPILIALFFVFQNSIELRGQVFLWIPDLSRPDPLFIVPVLMAVSMFGVTKIGQLGLPPNPQTNMMLYFMPIMMLVLFLRFASGLNLYYAVQNLASIPQQWLVAKERMRRASVTSPPPAPPRNLKR